MPQIPEYDELTSLASDDEFVVVDKSDTTQDLTGSTKRVTSLTLSKAHNTHLFDLANYGAVLDGTVSAPTATTNLAAWDAAVAALEAAGGGIITWTGDCYLNDPVIMNTDDPLITYQIKGNGKSSRLLLGAGLEDTYAFVHNTDDPNAVDPNTSSNIPDPGPQPPCVLIEGIEVDTAVAIANYTNGPSLLFTHLGTGSSLIRSTIHNCRYGITSNGYADHIYFYLVKFTAITALTSVREDYMFNQINTGDGHIIDACLTGSSAFTGSANSVAGGGCGLANFNTSKGSVVRASVGGSIKIDRCLDLLISDVYVDDNSTMPNKAVITITDSSVTVENCRQFSVDNTADNQALITIADTPTTAGRGSQVTVRKSSGRWKIGKAVDGATHARTPDLYIETLNDGTTIRWEDSNSNAGTATSEYYTAPPRFTASPAAGALQSSRVEIQRMFDDEAYKTCRDWQLYKNETTWVLRGIGQSSGTRSISTLATPTPPTPSADTLMYSTDAAVAVIYRFQFYMAGLSSPAVDSGAFTTTANKATVMNVTQDMPPCELRIWKSVNNGSTFLKFVAIPWRGGHAKIYDDGVRIQGVTWRTSGAAFLPPPATGGTNSSLPGIEFSNGNKTCYGSAAPTAGTWAAGDLVISTGSGSPNFYRCVVAGSPGTWQSELSELEISTHARAAADQIDRNFFIANQAYQVTGVRYVHVTPETTAATLFVQLTKDTGTAAPGAGTDLLTNNTNAGFDGKAAANTVQTGTLTGTVASLQLAAGDRLGIDYSVATNELVKVTVTVTLKKI